MTSALVMAGSGCGAGAFSPSSGVGLRRISHRPIAHAAHTTICMTEMVTVRPPSLPPAFIEACLL